MSDAELSEQREERTHRVRELVWHMRTKLEQNQLRMSEVADFLGKLEERRHALRSRARPKDTGVLDEALAELDSTHEEIRVVGEEMERRGEQLLAWEAEAAAKLRFHRRLMERAPLPFFLTDENGMIAEANEEAARMLHVPPAYLRNKPIVNFVSRRDVGNARSFVRAIGRSDQVLENVIVFRPRRGGPMRVTEVRACALERQHERALGWLVREVQRADGGTKGASAAAPTAEARSSETLAAISYELRSPIQTIQTAMSLLRAALPRELDGGRVQAHCTSILRASDTMSRIVRDLEDAAKVDAGTFVVERSPCDLRRLVEELVTANQPRAARRQLTLDSRLPHEAVIVDGDFVRLTQVVASFLDNALKLTPAGACVRVMLELHEDRARVEVVDEGRGLSPDDVTRAFERRWQAEVTSGVGSGLGLWLARAIAEAHGGKVGVQSVLGSGSRVWLEVPRRRE